MLGSLVGWLLTFWQQKRNLSLLLPLSILPSLSNIPVTVENSTVECSEFRGPKYNLEFRILWLNDHLMPFSLWLFSFPDYFNSPALFYFGIHTFCFCLNFFRLYCMKKCSVFMTLTYVILCHDIKWHDMTWHDLTWDLSHVMSCQVTKKLCHENTEKMASFCQPVTIVLTPNT
jgi:hypothetical protein